MGGGPRPQKSPETGGESVERVPPLPHRSVDGVHGVQRAGFKCSIGHEHGGAETAERTMAELYCYLMVSTIGVACWLRSTSNGI